jgi:formamidopyrimidine-DNA glycosylase
MPELPEVEAARTWLSAWTAGRRFSSRASTPEALRGCQVRVWQRHGKRLAAWLDNGRLLTAHLGMTGAFRRFDPGVPLPRHARWSADLEDGATLALVDPRGFGHVTLAARVEAVAPFDDLGPDALALLTAPAPGPALAAALGAAGPSVRAILKDRALDQRRVAGLGNIAILEGAFRARLHPHTPLGALSSEAFARLAAGLRDHLQETLAGCLATPDLVYVSQGGPNPFRVYGRADAPCPMDHAIAVPILRTTRAGRPTFTCPACQPEPAAD